MTMTKRKTSRSSGRFDCHKTTRPRNPIDINADLAKKIAKINRLMIRLSKKLLGPEQYVNFLHLYYAKEHSEEDLNRMSEENRQEAIKKARQSRSLRRKILKKDKLQFDQAVELRDQLIQLNRHFIHKRATHFANNWHDVKELYNEARFFAFYACHGYTKIDIRFITYLGRVINNHLQRRKVDNIKIFHVPEEMKQMLAKYHTQEKRMILVGNHSPSFGEVIKQLNIKKQQVGRLQSALATTVSASSLRSGNDSDEVKFLTVFDELAVSTDPGQQAVEVKEQYEKVQRIIGTLNLSEFDKDLLESVMLGEPKSRVAEKHNLPSITARNRFIELRQTILELYRLAS